jgi:cell division protein FtsZ
MGSVELCRPPSILVVGVGNGGCNAIGRIDRREIRGVNFLTVDADAQALSRLKSVPRLLVGEDTTRGLGAGGDVRRGLLSAEDGAAVRERIGCPEIVFVCAGMGGGIGTAVAPVVAEVAKRAGALTIGVVTRPFSFEGEERLRQAEVGISRLRATADTLIVISNDNLLSICPQETTIAEAFRLADDILLRAVECVAGLVTVPGIIFVKHNDLQVLLHEAGEGFLGVGRGHGHSRAQDAARAALSSPLVDMGIGGARRVLFRVVSPDDVDLNEVNSALQVIDEVADPEAQIVYGTAVDPSLGDDMEITVIAAGRDRLALGHHSYG